jgi:hypothetical protein
VVGGNWLANSHGIILHTTDGGATWIEQNIPTEKPLNKVFFINDSTGAAVGNDGTILRTTNGGETWTEYIWPVVNNEEIREPITRIYPNPTDDIINVEIENINNATIDIYNVSGRLVFNKALNSKVEKINVSGFPKGIYFVKVIQDKTVNILKVIVR